MTVLGGVEMSQQIEDSIQELLRLCHLNKTNFVQVADCIVNRILMVDEGCGLQRLRTSKELAPYILQLMQAGSDQPVARSKDQKISVRIEAKDDASDLIARLELLDKIYSPDRAVAEKPVNRKV